MAITLNIDGITVTAESAAEAAELLRALRAGNRATPENLVKLAPAAKKTGRKAVKARKGIGFMKLAQPEVALRFLRTIKEAGPTGVEAEGVRKALGVTEPKGVGSMSAQINRLLVETGSDPGTVYVNPRGPNGRVWKPGRQINQAIAKIEQRIAAH